jgi:hypothetical protein
MKALLKIVVAWSFIAVLGCGQEGSDPSLGALIRVDAATASQIQTFSFYVYGPQTHDGKYLPCDELLTCSLSPTDSSLDMLVKPIIGVVFANSSVGGAERISSVPSGGGRVVYVAAYDGGQPNAVPAVPPAVVANGCQVGINVNQNETTNIEIDLYPAPFGC